MIVSFLEKIERIKTLNSSTSSDRGKRMLLFVFTTYLAKGISLFVSLISVPLTYNYLGSVEFGILTTIVSLVSFIGFADLGVGYGLQNFLPGLIADKNKLLIKKYVSTTQTVQVLFAGLVFVASVLIVKNIDFYPIFKLENYNGSITDSFVLFLIFFCIGIPFSIVQKIQAARQDGYITQIWIGLGSLLSLVALLIFVKLKMPLLWILFALYGLQSFTLFISYVYELWFRTTDFRPSFYFWDLKIAYKILSVGLMFVLVQIFSILLNASTNLIIAGRLGVAEVADFSIIMRFVTLISGPIAMAFPSILPSINDALVNNDHAWIKRLTRKAILVVLFYSTVTSIVIFFLGQSILLLWVGNKFTLPDNSLIPIIAYSLFFQLNSLVSFIMLSRFYLKKIIYFYPISVVFAVCLKYFLIGVAGINGIIWGEILPMTVLFIFPSIYLLIKNKHL